MQCVLNNSKRQSKQKPREFSACNNDQITQLSYAVELYVG